MIDLMIDRHDPATGPRAGAGSAPPADPSPASHDGEDGQRRVPGEARAQPHARGGVVWVVLPTHNEAENLVSLVPAIEAHLAGRPAQVLIVDDASRDGTEAVVAGLRERFGNVTLYRRGGKFGIGSALRDGLGQALADPACVRVCTLDADWSHDPGALPALLAASADAAFVQGSRYVRGGRIMNWPWHRHLTSRVANGLCRWLGSRLREHTTNFRVYDRAAAAVAVGAAAAGGFEWIVSASLAVQRAGLPVAEVPITFTDRRAGRSKLSPLAELRWAAFLARLFVERYSRELARLPRFAAVGLSGIVVNQGLLLALVRARAPLAVASAAAIETSVLWNFVLHHRTTWRDRRVSWPRALGRFHLAVALGGALNFSVVMLAALTRDLPVATANLLGIGVAALANYALSHRWVWRPASRSGDRGARPGDGASHRGR